MGDIQPNHDWTLVELAGLQYSQPVVFLGTPTQSGDEEAVMRVRNIQYGGAFPDGTACPDSRWCFQVRPRDAFASRARLMNLYALEITGNKTCAPCFQVRLQEPSCRDGTHNFEHVHWFVLEAGEFKTDEGKLAQVRRTPSWPRRWANFSPF